nr:cyclophilin-like fold protein [uncultured Draconibacterium sp.]
MKIKITVGGKELTATMENNETAKDLVSLFPLTVTLEDYANTEKIFYPDQKLSTANAPSGYKPSVGDITYYAPWGDIAIFYKDFDFASGLINLGQIDGDISALTGSKNVEATFELMVD